MKLLVCASEYYPYGSGIANVAYNVVEKLNEKGVECTVCSPTGPDIYLGSRKFILKFGRLGILYYWHQVNKHLKKNVYNYDAVWLHQPLFISKSPFSNSLSTIHTTAIGHVESSNRLNYPFLIKMYYFVSSIIEKYSLRKIKSKTEFTIDSPKVNQELIKILDDDVNPTYIPNGVNTNRFKPVISKKEIRNKFNISLCSTVFLSVGRLAPQKRLFTMIDIFSKIQNEMSDCYLVIVGKGKLNEQLKNYISRHNIKNVKLQGFVSDDELPILYSCVDYYIMTSEYEGQPLTLLEAMSSGLPCIVSDIPNLRIVDEANCGIVVDFSDEDKATNMILKYINQDTSKHADNARKYAVDNLDWDIIADKYLEELQKLENSTL